MTEVNSTNYRPSAHVQMYFWITLLASAIVPALLIDRAWTGLQYITSYMTIGIGSISLFVALPTTAISILGMMCIALLSLPDGDGQRAQRRFRKMVIWFGHHRMYQ